MIKTKNPTKSTSNRIVALLVCVLLSFCFIQTVYAQSTVVNAGASTNQPAVGSTLTVTITISSVQNLGGIDATLQWNPTILTLTNSALNLGGANGVLHGTVNTDLNNQNPGDILVQETKVSGSYELVATEVGQTYSGFTGSGTIVTLTFNVVGAGNAGLSLLTDLADHPATGQTANNINHQDTANSVTAVASGSSTSPTPTSSATTAPSPTVPELPTIAVIILLIIAASATIALSTKLIKNRTPPSIQKLVSK